MNNKSQNKESNLSLFIWNIANPSLERAGKQALWLRQRKEDIFVLTEAKGSEGCQFLERYFQAYGYNVLFSKPQEKEFGVFIVSKHPLKKSDFSTRVGYLPSRVESALLQQPKKEIEIIGIYVPSRDDSEEKILRKRVFLENLYKILKTYLPTTAYIFCGDFNVLEPNHIPHYPFFRDWEYNFYQNLKNHQLSDAFRHINPTVNEYSWVGKTGDGYRYDHCFVSKGLLPNLIKSYYLHEPRHIRLSDHSALITEFEF